jgi:hypothetical protein
VCTAISCAPRISENPMETRRRLLNVATYREGEGRDWTTKLPKNAFKKGFLDGWSSIRGNAPVPAVPQYSPEPGKDPYRVGVALGVQEARAKPLADDTSATDTWLDNALRRPRRPD